MTNSINNIDDLDSYWNAIEESFMEYKKNTDQMKDYIDMLNDWATLDYTNKKILYHKIVVVEDDTEWGNIDVDPIEIDLDPVSFLNLHYYSLWFIDWQTNILLK